MCGVNRRLLRRKQPGRGPSWGWERACLAWCPFTRGLPPGLWSVDACAAARGPEPPHSDQDTEGVRAEVSSPAHALPGSPSTWGRTDKPRRECLAWSAAGFRAPVILSGSCPPASFRRPKSPAVADAAPSPPAPPLPRLRPEPRPPRPPRPPPGLPHTPRPRAASPRTPAALTGSSFLPELRRAAPVAFGGPGPAWVRRLSSALTPVRL